MSKLKKKNKKEKMCKCWPNCACILQGREGIDCPKPMSERDLAIALLDF